VYIETFEKYGGTLVYEKERHYQKNYAPEFALVFRRDSSMI
jgi:hypothetical protein